MFIGFGLFNLFSLLYHFFMIRILPPIDYGHLNTLIALFMLITVPANTVQTTITKFVAKAQYHHARGYLRHFFLLMAAVASSILILVTLGSSLLSTFFQINSRFLIILTGIALFFAMMTPVSNGGLQGLQEFGSLSLSLFMNGALKLIFGIFFVFLGWGLLGAMGAIAVAYLATAFLSFFLLYFFLNTQREKVSIEKNSTDGGPLDVSEAYQYFFPVGLTLSCFMVLTNIDLILVKHFFTPIEAGYYSISQMVGKIVLFLPLPIVMVMFPKIASLRMEDQWEKGRFILRQSLIVGVFLCGGACVFSLLFPSLLIQLLSGKVYLECLPLVAIFSVNMTFFSLGLILLYYHLSTSRREFLYPLVLLTLMEVGLILLFHDTLVQVLITVGIVGFCLLLTNFYLVFRSYPVKGKDLRSSTR